MISIFLDTNILFSRSTDFTTAGFLANLKDLASEIEVNDIYDKVQLVIPRLVLEELKVKQIESHDELAQKFKNVRFTEAKIDICENYCLNASSIFDAAEKEMLEFATVKIMIEDYPSDSSLSGIIERAVKKQPPFEGKGKESDKGFKDAIIWESVLAFKRRNRQDTILLFSGDQRITDNYLKKEYKDLFGDEIFLIQRKDANSFNELISQVLSCLDTSTKQITHAQELKNQLLSVICDDLIEPLYLDSLYHYRDLDWEVFGTSIKKVEIVDTVDEDDRISYSVLITLCFQFVDREGTKIEEKIPCSFEFIYSLSDNYFYLTSYAMPDGGIETLATPLEIE